MKKAAGQSEAVHHCHFDVNKDIRMSHNKTIRLRRLITFFCRCLLNASDTQNAVATVFNDDATVAWSP